MSRSDDVKTWFFEPGAWWSPRHWRFWVLVFLIVYTLAGFLLLPWIAKRQIVSVLGETLQRPVALEELKINPYVLSIDAQGFSISENDGEPLIGFDRLFVNFQLSSLFRWAWTFREIRLESPSAELIRYAVGDTNFSRLPSGESAPQPAPESPGGGMLRLLVHELSLSGGLVEFVDHVPETRFEQTLGPINVTVFDLSTLPDDSGQQRVAILTEHGTELTWSGSVTLNPLHSSGELDASGPYLPLLFRYFRDQVAVDVPAGRVELGFDYDVSVGDDGSVAAAIDDFSMAVRDIAVNSAGQGGQILNLPEMSLSGGMIRWPEKMIAVERLAVVGPAISLLRSPEGMLNVEGLVADPADGATETANGEEGVQDPWSVRLEQFEIIDLAARFEDQALREPGMVEVTDLDFSLGQISNEQGARFPLRLAVQTAPGGETVVEGSLAVMPVAEIEGKLTITDLQLALIQPYLNDSTTARIDQGRINMGAEFSVGEEQALTTSGTFSLGGLSVSDSGSDERLLGWDELAIDRFEFDATSGKFDVSELGFVSPYIRLLINEDQSSNFQQLVVVDKASNEETPAGEAETDDAGLAPDTEESAPLQVMIGRVSIQDGSADFTDLALPLPFAAKIVNLEGEITTLATASTEPAQVRIEGQVDEYGLARIQGSLMPAGPTENTDIQVLFRNVKMPDLSPYTIKFAGREIADGSIDLDLRYQIEDGIMVGANKFVISDLELGEKVDYPGATSLPLGLAVALLKGPDGKIDVDLPVEGDVNDPEFRVGGIVVKALFNLITSIVTSPFRLLGNLVGIGNAEDFDIVEFEPGRAELTPPEKEKIAKLAEALNQRPGLVLQVPQSVDVEADRAALQVIRVDSEINAALDAQGDSESADQMLTARRREVLESLFDARFPETSLETVEAGYMEPENPDEPEGKLALDETAYLAGLRQRLIAATEVSESDLVSLARARGESVIATLTAEGGIGAERVELLAPADADTSDSGWVEMKLEVDTGP